MTRRARIVLLVGLALALLVGWAIWEGFPGADGRAHTAVAAPAALAAVAQPAPPVLAPESEPVESDGNRRIALSDPDPQEADADTHDEEAAWGKLRVAVNEALSGKPVAGLSLQLTPLGLDGLAPETGGASFVRNRTWETDANGQIAAELRPGLAFELEVRGIGLSDPLAARTVDPMQPGEVRQLSIAVDEGRLPRFFVRVVAEEDGRPIAAAELLTIDAFGGRLEFHAPIEQGRWSVGPALARTDAQGIAALPITPLFQRRFTARAAGRGFRVFGSDRAADAPERAQVVRLAPSAALFATIVDGQGNAVPGAEVRVLARFADLGAQTQRFGLLGGEHAVTVRADAEARAEFEGLTADVPFQIWLRGAEGDDEWQRVEPAPLPLEPGEQRKSTFVLHDVGLVEGIARDQHGAPVADAELLLLAANAASLRYENSASPAGVVRRVRTDPLGAFRLEAVPAGSWVLVPPNPRPRPPMASMPRKPPEPEFLAPVPTRFEVGSGGGTTWLELTLWRGLYVHGRVVPPDERQPLVRGALGGELGFAWGYAEPDGSFALGPLPAGEVELVALALGRGDLHSSKVRAQAGERDVELRFEGATGTLALVFLDGQSGASIGATVELWRIHPGGGIDSRSVLHLDRNDTKERELPAGTWRLFATAPGDLTVLSSVIEVRADESTGPVTLRLLPGGHLDLSARDDKPIGPVRVRIGDQVVWERTLAARESTRVLLPVGDAEVDARGEVHRVRIYAGETTAPGL